MSGLWWYLNACLLDAKIEVELLFIVTMVVLCIAYCHLLPAVAYSVLMYKNIILSDEIVDQEVTY